MGLGRRDVGLVSFTAALANAASGVAALALQALGRANVLATSSGSSSATRSASTFGFSWAYVTRTASAAALADSNVSATARATYWP